NCRTNSVMRPPARPSERAYVVLQIAADRPHLRYGSRFDEFVGFVRSLILRIEEDVYLVPHTPDDQKLYSKLAKELPAEVWPLWNSFEDTEQMISVYAGARFTISTRGHSQICSVGNGVPTFAISTHPKVEGFADVCGMLRWCYCFDREDVVEGRRTIADPRGTNSSQ
ncbi:polysaccharide pyruvyl transferase family protein, partial [Chloroflexota bacterium]